MLKWIIGVVAALLLAVGGYAGYDAFVNSDGYGNSPERIYDNPHGEDGHDHGYYGVV